MNYIALFFAGALLCNCLPHLASGLQGAPFPTPFAKPGGIGDSSPLTNFLWGGLNLLVAVVLLSRFPLVIGFNPEFGVFAAAFLALGVFMSLHFGKVRQGRSQK